MTLLMALTMVTLAQADTATATFRQVRFASGAELAEVRLHYRTLGRLRQDSRGSNAVLLLHGTGGSGGPFLNANFAGEHLERFLGTLPKR